MTPSPTACTTRIPEHHDTNFGVIFSVWDRIFRTASARRRLVYPATGVDNDRFPIEESARFPDLVRDLRPTDRPPVPGVGAHPHAARPGRRLGPRGRGGRHQAPGSHAGRVRPRGLDAGRGVTPAPPGRPGCGRRPGPARPASAAGGGRRGTRRAPPPTGSSSRWTSNGSSSPLARPGRSVASTARAAAPGPRARARRARTRSS